MKYLVLLLAWITPAFIAGVLGWKGVWGTGSAFADYLVPIPPIGGVLHVPSFLLAACIILLLSKQRSEHARFATLAALVIFFVAQTLQMDFSRLNAWLFTDFSPAGSPVRFKGNPFLLFIATDALWVALYGLFAGYIPRMKHWLVLPLAPLAIVAANALLFKSVGPQFHYGFTVSTRPEGSDIAMVYTPSPYDEQQFRQWLEEESRVRMPWDSANSQQIAVLFTRSMQAVKYGRVEDTANVVATFCYYEEDMSSAVSQGYAECFSSHPTFRQQLKESLSATSTGLGKEVDRWYSMARICEDVRIPEKFEREVEKENFCRNLKRRYPEKLAEIVQQFGDGSEQVAFVRSKAILLGLDNREDNSDRR